MHDMLPRKPTTAVAELKKSFMKDSLFGNGMNPSSASPSLMSPAHSGGSSSPAQDEGINMKMRPDSPTHIMKDKMANSTANCLPSMMPKPLTPSIVPATTTPPLSSPSHGSLNRTSSKLSPKQRRNPSTDSRHRNQYFENSICANNNNNAKQEGKFPLQRHVVQKVDELANRTPSRNSISDDISTSSLTPTTDEQTNQTSNQNLELSSILDGFNSDVFTKVFNDIPKDDDSQGMLFPDTNEGLKEFDAVITSFNKNNSGESIFDPSRTASLDLDGALLDNIKDPLSPITKQLPNASGSNITSPLSFEAKGQSRKMVKSHLQDILGVTDTQRLENMSRPIDSVPYKSPTTTMSYSTGLKPTINQPCTMAPPSRHPTNITSPSFKPRQQFQFGNEGQMFRPNAHGYMDNGNWNRGSPRNMPPNMKSPSMNPSYVENTISPSGNVNPMSGLQSTVDSIPTAPSGSEPGTPTQFMGPPLSATPSPGGGRMRPPPSPSVTGDKRCTSADSVAAGNGGRRVANKRERTKSADSKEEERKDPNAPKNKRRKSKSKEDVGKKPEIKISGRGSMKEDKMQRHDSALTSLLNGQTNDPYVYIFSTDAANKAAKMVNAKNAPSIILCHQSFLGNCRVSPSERYKSTTTTEIKSELTDTPTITMPTTCRSPTEITIEKSEPSTLPLKSPKIERAPSVPIKAINLQETKPLVLPLPDATNVPKTMKTEASIPIPSMTSQIMDQDEMSAEKMRDRKNKLGKLKKLNQILFQGDSGGNPPGQSMQQGPFPPGWTGHPGPVRYPSPMDKLQPGMKDMPDGMMGRGRPGMTPESAEWLHLVQEHHVDKMRRQEAGMSGELASRPPPPYAPSQRYMVPDGYIPEPRMPMDHMGHPRMQRMAPGHRILRMPQETRGPTGYIHPRMGMPRHYAPLPNQPQGQHQRMPMYDPYGGPPTMRHPSRLPHPGLRAPGENYPFSEQLMKQASYYNSVPPYESESGNPGEWSGADGSQRLSHMPGNAPSPAVVPQGQVLGPMDMNSRITPGVPNRQGFDSMGHYPGDVQHQRYDMLPPPMNSPTNPMDVRLRGPSMVDAMARRGGQRPPDLNLANQMPPRSPMNYPGHMASPSLAVMNHQVGPRFSNPGDMGHPPQQSPMLSRSPSVGMGQHLTMGPTSAGVEQQVLMGPVGPQSAGPMSNPPPNEWPGPGPVPGTPTANSTMMHHSMTSQHGGMTPQQVMMPSQSNMMPQQPPGMMASPGMMSQPGMMGPQQQALQRVPSTPSSGKPTQSTLSLMMDRMNMFKMPDKSPLYQDAVKDTASPPPLTHQNEPPPLTHNPMPGTMRMGTPIHPPTYDTRMPHPHMAPHHESYPHPQGYPPGHPSPMPANSMPGAPMMMNMAPESIPPPSDYPQGQRGGFSEVTDFDLRNILPSERPSQTISYRPPDNNMPNQFSSPEWAGPDSIRSHLMPGPPHPAGPRLGMP